MFALKSIMAALDNIELAVSKEAFTHHKPFIKSRKEGKSHISNTKILLRSYTYKLS